MAVTLERLSFAFGIVLARTWRQTVRRHPDALVDSLLLLVIGTTTNPMGRTGMQDGSSPFITIWMASTSTVAYTTKLPESSVQLSCSTSSTLCEELLATCVYVNC